MARAKASAGAGRSRRSDGGESFAVRVGLEFAGVVLLALALLSSLALATYSPSDAVFRLEKVANRAGVVGATLAGWLFAGVGHGAVVIVVAVATASHPFRWVHHVSHIERETGPHGTGHSCSQKQSECSAQGNSIVHKLYLREC